MDERNAQRHVADREVQCHVHGETVQAFIYDICIDGCMVDTRSARVAVGDRLSFRLMDGICIEGSVVWRAEECAGVRFDQRLHPAIVLHLAIAPVCDSITQLQLRDRFGRPLSDLPITFPAMSGELFAKSA